MTRATSPPASPEPHKLLGLRCKHVMRGLRGCSTAWSRRGPLAPLMLVTVASFGVVWILHANQAVGHRQGIRLLEQSMSIAAIGDGALNRINSSETGARPQQGQQQAPASQPRPRPPPPPPPPPQLALWWLAPFRSQSGLGTEAITIITSLLKTHQWNMEDLWVSHAGACCATHTHTHVLPHTPQRHPYARTPSDCCWWIRQRHASPPLPEPATERRCR